MVVLFLFGCSSSDNDLCEVSISNAVSSQFFPLTGEVYLTSSNCKMSTNINSLTLTVNDELVSNSDVQIDSEGIRFSPSLNEGENRVFLLMASDDGKSIVYDSIIWAGSQTLTVTVKNTENEIVVGAQVKVILGDDHSFFLEKISDENGIVIFENVPNRTVAIEAFDSSNAHVVEPVSGGSESTVVILRGFAAPSEVNNNDLSQGTNGWTWSDGAEVEIVTSVEENALSQLQKIQRNMIRQPRNPNHSHLVQLLREIERTQSGGNVDRAIMLTTSEQGPATLSRTFRVASNVESLSFKFRFETSEVPGGYYGSEFNDYFSVTVRNQRSGEIYSFGRSMNDVSLFAFTSNGVTAWYSDSIDVEENDIVQVDLVVANVLDGLYDSSVVFGAIESTPVRISGFEAYDLDGQSLEYFSGGEHTYLGGTTPVYSTVELTGSEGTVISAVKLEVLQGGGVVAEVESSGTEASALLGAIGSEGRLSVSNPAKLFSFSASNLINLSNALGSSVTLRLRVQTETGSEVTKTWSRSLPVLTRVTGLQRYSLRDDSEGGDDWGGINIQTVLTDLGSNFFVNDISNMHGGRFLPHVSHKKGVDADFRIGSNTAAVGEDVVRLLVSALDNLSASTFAKIKFIFLTYEIGDAENSLTQYIQGARIQDRMATDILRYEPNHTGHFHLRVLSE